MTEKLGAGSSGGGGFSGGFGWVAGAVVGVVVAGTAFYFATKRPEPAPEEAAAPSSVMAPVAAGDGVAPEPEAPATETTVAADTPAPATVAEPTPAETPEAPAAAVAEAVAVIVPSFDTVRVDSDGSALVAGRAAAAATISVLVDGEDVSTAVADARGGFAALFTLMPSDEPRIMSLVATSPDGTPIPSTTEVVIAPFAAPEPVVVASAEPAAETSETAADPLAEPAAPEAAAEPVTEAAPAPAQGPEILIVDETGVRKAAEAVPTAIIVVDTIGYGASDAVEIAGRGLAGAFARVYLDNRDVATVPVAADGGWNATLSGVEPGLYTLRVDQIDAAGKVSSRFETPFLREEPETVSAALNDGAESAVEPASEPPTQTVAEPVAAAAETAQAPAVEEVAVASSTMAAPSEAPAAETPQAPVTRAAIVTVQPGYSLWRIARENYGEGALYVKVFEANKDQIRDPDLIYPGQIFTVPTGQ